MRRLWLLGALLPAALGLASCGGSSGLSAKSGCAAFLQADAKSQAVLVKQLYKPRFAGDSGGGAANAVLNVDYFCNKNPKQTVAAILAGQGELASAAASPQAVATQPSSVSADCLTAAKQQASKDLIVLLGYDYRNTSDHLAKASAVLTTSSFGRSYLAQWHQTQSLIIANHSVDQVEVSAVGYMDGGCTHPRYLVAMNQTVSRSSAPGPSLDRSTVEVTMSQVDGRYKVDNLKPV